PAAELPSAFATDLTPVTVTLQDWLPQRIPARSCQQTRERCTPRTHGDQIDPHLRSYFPLARRQHRFERRQVLLTMYPHAVAFGFRTEAQRFLVTRLRDRQIDLQLVRAVGKLRTHLPSYLPRTRRSPVRSSPCPRAFTRATGMASIRRSTRPRQPSATCFTATSRSSPGIRFGASSRAAAIVARPRSRRRASPSAGLNPTG